MKGMDAPVSVGDVSAAGRARQLLPPMTTAAKVEGGKRSEGYGEGLEGGGAGGEGDGAHGAVGTRDDGGERGQQPAVVAGDVGMGGEDPVFAIRVGVAGGATRCFGHVFEAVGAAGRTGGAWEGEVGGRQRKVRVAARGSGDGGTFSVDALLHVVASVVVREGRGGGRKEGMRREDSRAGGEEKELRRGVVQE